MKIRSLVILLIILAFIAGTGAYIIYFKDKRFNESNIGRAFLKDLPVNRISSIAIKGPEKNALLKKTGEQWLVANCSGYPANFPRIAGFVRRLKDAKIGNQFESGEETLKRLSLKDPGDNEAPKNSRGIRICLKDQDGVIIKRFLLGKKRKGPQNHIPNSQYTMVEGKPEIYLIDTYFPALERGASIWFEDIQLKVEPRDIKKIKCYEQGGKTLLYSFARPKKGEGFREEFLPDGIKVAENATKKLAGALNFIQVENVTKPDDSSSPGETDFSKRIDYHLFNGTVYSVYPGPQCSNKSGLFYLKLRAKAARPPINEKDESKEPGPKNSLQEIQGHADRLKKWIYMIPKKNYTKFITDPRQLEGKGGKPKPYS